MVKRKGDRNAWVRDALKDRGYTQRDLARAWGVTEASISRFISGEEAVDPPLSRSLALAAMLGIAIDDLAKGLGLAGKAIVPSVRVDAGMPPPGTFRMDMLEPGRVRVIMVQDVTPAIASQLVSVLGGGAPAAA